MASVSGIKPTLIIGTLLIGCSANFGLFAQSSFPGEKRPPLATPDHSWGKDAKSRKLNPDEVDGIKRKGFVITGESFLQIFQPYNSGEQVFITSDSIINAYAVLLEDSVLRLELVHVLWRQFV